MLRCSPISTLFPYTTLFRSLRWYPTTRRVGNRTGTPRRRGRGLRSEEHTSELQSQSNLVCRLLLEKKNKVRGAHHDGSHHASEDIATPGLSGQPLVLCPTDPLPALRVVALVHRPHLFFFFNDRPPTEFHTLSLHDALPI